MLRTQDSERVTRVGRTDNGYFYVSTRSLTGWRFLRANFICGFDRIGFSAACGLDLGASAA